MRITAGRLILPTAAMVAVAAAALLIWGNTPASVPTASADVQGTQHLELDMDPTNGTRPCSPIDATRTGPTSGTYQVAVCLEESAGSPDGFEARVVWTGGVATAGEVTDTGDALNDNPDFNDGAAPNGFGTNWSCTGFGFAFPKGDDPVTVGTTDAHISCNEKSFAAGTMTAEPGLLALITMTASGTGTETFVIDAGGSSVNSPASTNILCSDVTCPGGTVNQGGGPPATNTPTATATGTPTATATPCTGPCATATPTETFVVGFITYTPTSTATVETTATPVPPGGETPPAAGGGQPTAPQGGGAGVVVRPPDTGSGGLDAAQGRGGRLMAVSLAGFGAVALAAAGYGVRRRKSR